MSREERERCTCSGQRETALVSSPMSGVARSVAGFLECKQTGNATRPDHQDRAARVVVQFEDRRGYLSSPHPATAAWPIIPNCPPALPLVPGEVTVQRPLEDVTVEFEPSAQRIKAQLP